MDVLGQHPGDLIDRRLPDPGEWASGSAPVGVYAVASASMLRDYGVESLVDYGGNDASAVCAPGERRAFEREPYSGYVQEWTGCNGLADATLLTFSAAPRVAVA